MSEFRIKPDEINNVSSSMKKVAGDLLRINQELDQIKGNLSIDSGSVEFIRTALTRIQAGISKEEQGSRSLSEALSEAVMLYKNTDSLLAGMATSREVSLRTIAASLLQAVLMWIYELLERAGIIPGGANDPNSGYVSDPVNTCTGNYVSDITELKYSGTPQLAFIRHYNSLYIQEGPMGLGWTHNLEISLQKEGDHIDLVLGNGTRERYEMREEGIFISKFNPLNVITQDDNGYICFRRFGDICQFDQNGTALSISSREGRKIMLSYEDGRLAQAVDAAGRTLSYSYDEDGHLVSVTDILGRTVTMQYQDRLLYKVISADGRSKEYAYDESCRLESIVNNAGNMVIWNEYDEENRVVMQKFPDDTVMSFAYEGNDLTVKDRNGAETVYRHNDKFQLTAVIRGEEKETYTYDERNLRVAHTSAGGGVVYREYDEKGNTVALTDPLGNRVEMAYDEGEHMYDLPVMVTQKNGGVTRLAYDDAGHLIRQEDALGNVVEFAYENGALISILYPDRSTECFEYDECGNIVRHIDKMGGITVNEYDAAGRRISMTDPRGSRWSYEYDECDRILKITDPMGNTRSYEYSATGKITAITDYDGSKRQWSYNVSDLAESYVDQNGETTRLAYNEIDLLSEVILPGGGKIVHEYDGAGRKIATVDELGCRTTRQYNADGRLTEESNGRYTRRFEYDPAGNVIQITDKNGSVSSVKRDAMGNVTELTRGDGTICRYEYDLEGQCTKKIDPTGAETEFDYDSCRRLTEVRRCGVQLRHYTYYPSGRVMDVKTADGVTQHYRYDECGNMTARESSTGYRIEYIYDALGRRTQMSDSEGRKVSYTYDASGRVTEHTDEKGNITKFAYSPSGKMISVEDALTNRTFYEYDRMGRIQKIIAGEGENSRSTTLERNYKGLITRITDAAGNSSRYEYDEFGSMILHESAEDAHTLYTYNADGKPVKILYGDGNSVEMTYDPMGRMTAMTDWNGRMELEYDPMGRLTHVTDADGRDARYGWDPAGYMTSVQYPDGGTAEFEHDEAGRVRSIKAGTGEIRYAYDATGRLQRKETDDASVQYAYSPDGKVKSVEFSDREGKLSSLELQYDLGGNIAEKKEWHRAEGEGTENRTSYEYDALGRVTAVFMNGAPVRAYEYDAYGNRLSEKAADKEIHSTYNNLNQLVSREITQDGRTSTEEWRYNKDGHTVSVRGENTAMDFRYDQTARLAEVCHEDGRKTVYEYDGLGSRRAQKEYASGSVKSRQYFADLTDAHSAPLFMEEDGVGSDFIRDGEIAGLLSGGSLYFYQCDQQGSVYNYLAQDGSTLCEYRYDEFGNELLGSAGNRQPFGYTGLLYDAAGSSWMTPARTYAPETGRFLQRDRERFIHIGNPQSVNLYTYCLNNPLLYIDPDGTDCYYFYLPEWENEAINDQRRLAEQYGYSTDQVHLIPITNAQELTDGWNAMGYENGRQVDIDTVVINSHANPEGLGFGHSGSGGFTTQDARNLNNQSMDQLILYGCNAGHRDYMDTNIAEAFSHRTNNAPVMASDGTVYGMNSDETYDPRNDGEFQRWARRAGNGGRDNEGWQIYQQVDGQTVVTNTGLRSLTVVGMLEALRSLAPVKESSE